MAPRKLKPAQPVETVLEKENMERQEFIQARDVAVIETAKTGNWQIFYEFYVEYGLPQIPIACPREKMAMVRLLACVILCPGTGDSDAEMQKDQLKHLASCGYKVFLEEQYLENTNEDNRRIDIPTFLL